MIMSVISWHAYLKLFVESFVDLHAKDQIFCFQMKKSWLRSLMYPLGISWNVHRQEASLVPVKSRKNMNNDSYGVTKKMLNEA